MGKSPLQAFVGLKVELKELTEELRRKIPEFFQNEEEEDDDQMS